MSVAADGTRISLCRPIRSGAAILPVVVAILLCPAPAWAEAPVLTCGGAFARTSDEAALVKQFGRENVVAGKIPGPEGSSERGTIVYPKDPARRLEITWLDTAKRRRPASILVRDGSGWAIKPAGANSATIALGTRLAEVESANGKPFELSGFEWDYGGYATDWKGGALDRMEGGCSLSLRFGPDPKAGDKALNKVSGDRTFNSSDAAMKAARPSVGQISLGWADQ